MAVAKRQRREKLAKIEESKVGRLERKPQLKQTALQDRPIYIGQAQGEEKKKYKKGSQNWARGPFFSSSLLDWHALLTEGCIFLYFLNKTEL